jgi:hypothetical protein
MLEMLTRLEVGTLGAALQLIMLEEGTCLIESPAAMALDVEGARTDVIKEVEDICDNTIVGEGMLRGDASWGSLGGWSGKFSLALGPLKFLAAVS